MSNETHDRLQSACFQWLWNTYPETRRTCFAALNELPRYPGETAKAHMIRIMKAKATGLVPGVFDLLFYWKGVLYCFDIKVGRDHLSDEQLKFNSAIVLQGGVCYVIRSQPEFEDIIKKILTQ